MLTNVDLIAFYKSVQNCAELCRTLKKCAVKVKKSLRRVKKSVQNCAELLKLCEESAVKM